MKKTFLILFAFSLFSNAFAQPYKDSTLSTDVRVQDLLNRMSKEEKFFQLFMIPGDISPDSALYEAGIFGLQMRSSPQQTSITEQLIIGADNSGVYASTIRINEMQRYFMEHSRLGIPTIPFEEALHGLVLEGSTAFPQSIGLAASWNTALMGDVAAAIAEECRSRGIRQVLSPVVNIASDVRWGRTEETYGEDPFLASEMGVAYVSAFESRGIIATPKHFIANVGDGGRDSYPIHWNERLMREIYLPPFEACINRGGSRSVMTSYNSYDGTPCTSNNWLNNEILRKEWGFKGFIISDAGATGGANVLHMTAPDYYGSTVQAMEGGLDVIFQTNIDHSKLFVTPFLNGSLADTLINQTVTRVLRQKFDLGLFDAPYNDPRLADSLNGCPAHLALAREAARQSIVLLQNKNETLPINHKTTSIAVIGPDAMEVRLGGYSGPGTHKVSILQGISSLVASGVSVNYAPGCDRVSNEFVTLPGSALSCVHAGRTMEGLLGEYFSNITWSGQPVLTRVDTEMKFQWTLFSPDPAVLANDFFSVRWTGKLTAPQTGSFKIGVDGNDGYRLFIDGKLVLDQSIKRTRKLNVADFYFQQGRVYEIRIEYFEPLGNTFFRLVWNVGVKSQDAAIEQAVRLASQSDIAVIVAGIEEGEFLDRAYLGLPGRQEELILKVAATGTPTVVVLVGGSAITMNPWIDSVDAILDVWHPGEQGGNAVAQVLLGHYNPAGRLPITFPVFEGQLPLVYNHKPTGRGDDYINLTGEALFPFGFGLSYTSFEYSGIRLSSSNISKTDTCILTCKVTNTGKVAGDEVVQLYIRDEIASVARPVIELKGFRRIHLKAGESQELSFSITPEMLTMLDKNLDKVIEPGNFIVMLGASSKDIRLRAVIEVVD